jgi:hypothetical protein
VVHAANRRVTQHFHPPDVIECWWTKDVINATIVDGGIAGRASEVA